MREIPEARESEVALLGSILIDPRIMDRVGLDPRAFYDAGHKLIYEAMRSIGSRELDVVVLTELLERRGQLERIGGKEYLLRLLTETPMVGNYEAYERAIADTAVRRQVIELCGGLAGAAFDEGKNINDAISETVSELVKSARPKGGADHISEYLRILFETVETRAADPKPIYGLETGLVDFDKITHGLQRGEEFILAGQPGTGKSLLAFQMACGMAQRGHAGAIYSLEMTGVAMIKRRISALSKISTYNLNSGVGMNDRWVDFVKAVETMEKLPIYISDASNWTTLQMRADLSRLKQQQNIEWFVVDYHDLLSDNIGSDFREKSAFLSQQLHMICKDLDLAGLVIQSINKEGYHSVPKMQNLSGSTKVMHTADQIAFLIADKNDPNVVKLYWDKVREGENANRAVLLTKIAGFPAFGNYKKENQNQAGEIKSEEIPF